MGCNASGGLTFSVTDTGIGMSDDEIPVAVSRFGRVGDVLSRTRAGTGLGLSIAISLVELHKGTIDIVSEKGIGTTVTIAFPPERSVDPADEPRAAKSAG